MEVGDPTTAGAADRKDVARKLIAGARTNGSSAALGAPTVPRSFIEGSPRQGKSDAWNNVKWHDHAPFIGGDVITAGGFPNGRPAGHCTTGLPAVRKRDGRPVTVMAAHCFQVGTRVYTGGGKTWGWKNGLRGDHVGTVTARSRLWDAGILVGANNNGDVSDVDKWIPLTSVKYSHKGDYVCHSGAKSAYRGHSSPCRIKVTKPDYEWLFNKKYPTRGVEGIDINGWGCVGGDSRATVWAKTSNPKARQARGIISDGGKDGTPDQRRVDWTEAVDIFNAFGLKLNPKT